MGAPPPDKVRRIHDRIGRRQDTQAFHERLVIDELIAHAEFGTATSILEFGCGTGRLATELPARHLPDGCRYIGIDIGATMVRPATERIRPWAERATVRLSDASARLPVADEAACMA